MCAEQNSVKSWWISRLTKGVTLDENPDVGWEFRKEKYYWCPRLGLDAAYIAYREYARDQDRLPVDYNEFESLLRTVLVLQEPFGYSTARRRDLVTGEWTVDCETDDEGVPVFLLKSLRECREKLPFRSDPRPQWPTRPDPEAERKQCLEGYDGDRSVALWWWWKLRRGETVPCPNDWKRPGWHRVCELKKLFYSYKVFCHWRGEEILGNMTYKHPYRVLPSQMFMYALARLLPGGRLLPYAQHARLDRLSGEPDKFFLPPLASCREAFEQAVGLSGQEWEPIEDNLNAGQASPDYGSVADWWMSLLTLGVTVHDETSPYGLKDLFWNQTPSLEFLLRSYRAFCSRSDRSPLDEQMFLSALIPLLVPPSGEKLLVVAPVFAQAQVSPAIPETVIHLKECFRVALLNVSRDRFLKVTGMRSFPWPKDVCQNWSIAGEDFTKERFFNLWMHRLLARAGALKDDARSDESAPISRLWPLFNSVYSLHDDYFRFCTERCVSPAGSSAFFQLLIRPAQPGSLGMSLREYRRAYEDAIGRRVHWPEVQKTPRRKGWEAFCDPVFFEEDRARELDMDEFVSFSDDPPDDWDAMPSCE